MNILLIEDNPAHLKLVHLVLSAAGNTVSDSHTGEQAMAAIAQERPQLILLDLALPDMDGLALVRRLKSDPAARDIPIVAITAFPDLWSRERAIEAGCDAYLVKPIDTRSLVGQLAGVTKR